MEKQIYEHIQKLEQALYTCIDMLIDIGYPKYDFTQWLDAMCDALDITQDSEAVQRWNQRYERTSHKRKNSDIRKIIAAVMIQHATFENMVDVIRAIRRELPDESTAFIINMASSFRAPSDETEHDETWKEIARDSEALFNGGKDV